jgi:hypothetical protein
MYVRWSSFSELGINDNMEWGTIVEGFSRKIRTAT